MKKNYLTELSSLTALQVGILITFDAVSDTNGLGNALLPEPILTY